VLSIALACNVISCNSSEDSPQTPEAPSINQTPEGSGTDQTGEVPGTENQKTAKKFRLENAFPTLSFGRVTDIQNAGDGSDRLFIVQQEGVISVIDKEKGAGATSSVFLDLKDRVLFDEGESGLLSMAFHPDFENNGYIYVHYTAKRKKQSILSRFSVSDDPDIADPDSELTLLKIRQPSKTHNGGQVVFGPQDGYLYMTMGDGGPPGGRRARSQDLTNLFGTVIRIDVDNPDDELNYGIPVDNPFAGNDSGIREEIFAYGLRNPFKIAFDPFTGILWAGDVGELSREELDIVEPGLNYGWPIMEGNLCFKPRENCDPTGLEPPVLDYGRDLGKSIIAGIVYNGSELPELKGFFIYGDFLSGRVWALDYNGNRVTQNTQIVSLDGQSLTTFGVDEVNEPYIGTLGGEIYRLVKEDKL